ncbi:hypothetical protein [Thalassospira xiamenensis]|uniref:hypothetical protein n=1 Tax=Thalassospira xiamenensis TaxID=220697 RepID=UPI0012E8B449|nr:hypothetical protein [Thalassospira xiamenensis]
MADPRPAIDDRLFGISERTIDPLAINSASQSRHPGQPIQCRPNPDAIRAC